MRYRVIESVIKSNLGFSARTTMTYLTGVRGEVGHQVCVRTHDINVN